MASHHKLLGEAIAALETDGFGSALIAWLAETVPHDNIALLAYFQDRGPDLLLSHSPTPEVHANMERGYLAGVYLLDPFHQLHLQHVKRGLFRLADVAPDQFQRNKYFIDYYQKTTLIDEIAFIAAPSSGISLQLCLGRDRKSGRKFSNADINNARALAPVVEAMLNRHWSALDTEGRYNEEHVQNAVADAARRKHGIQLTPREIEVVFLLLKGHSSASIGLELGISYQTVKVFRRQIYRKCGISSQAELFGIFMPLLSEQH